MNIGTIIKNLRQERGMVQEQVAEYLNVSTQAVSRWETGSALPDITQVPALANLFDCSADILLGIDITAKEKQIEAIIKESHDYVTKRQHEKAENTLREALKEYPNSYGLMAHLAFVLYNVRNQNGKDKNSIQTEVITLCEKILAECTDDKYRHMAIQELCSLCSETGKIEKAKSLADKMPSKFVSKEYLITNALSGAERYKHKQKEIATNALEVLRDIVLLNNNVLKENPVTGPYNLDECIVLHHKVLDMINILIEDENFGDFNRVLVDAHLHLTFFNIQKKDSTAALNHFRLAAKYAIIYDTIPQADDSMGEYTNLLFRGIKSLIHGSATPDNRSQYLLNRSGELDSYLPAPELDTIKEELRKYAVASQ